MALPTFKLTGLAKALHYAVAPLSFATLSALPGSVLAQGGGGVGIEEFSLEEVIITATKREENLQNVSVSVTALSGDKISEAGLENLQDIATYTPNFYINSGQNNFAYIRGLGTAGSNAGFEQSVGLYVDGIYYARSAYFGDLAFDMERFEVLRGPQGTLFGKNTVAGALNITSRNPSDDEAIGGELRLVGGNLDKRVVNASLTGKLAENWSARLSLQDFARDGQLDNITLDEDWGGKEQQNLRFKLRHADDVSNLTLMAETVESDFTGIAQQEVLAANGFDADGDETERNVGYNDRELNNFSAVYNRVLGESTQLTVIAGFSDTETENLFDSDFTGNDFASILSTEDYQQTSIEVRLASVESGEFEWLAGFFYFDSDVDINSDQSADFLVTVPVPPPAPPGTTAQVPFDSTRSFNTGLTTETLALFGQLTWNFNDDARIKLGLRGNTEDKTFDHQVADENRGVVTVAQAFGAIEPEIIAGLSDSRDESNVAPTFTAEYDFSDNVLSYFSINRGFKAGGFNADALTVGELTFDHEESTSLEVGIKSTLLDRRLYFNLTVFRTEFEDLQVNNFDGTRFVVRNAAEATSQGVETELSWRASRSLSLGASIGYLDATYDRYRDAACTVAQSFADGNPGNLCTQDLSGETLTYAPELSASFSGQYVAAFDSWDLVLGADINYNDEFRYSTDLDPVDTQDAYALLNARVSVQDNNDLWSVAVVGRNLTDELYKSGGSDIPAAFTGVPNRHFAFLGLDRQVEAELTLRF